MIPQISRAGEWFLLSGIQEPDGGVARYHRADLGRNEGVSTEITGYAASTFVYLHSLTHDPRYLDRAIAAARFLTETAWDRAAAIMPFELGTPGFSYFFDCGIVVRGLLAVWRATGTAGFLDCATAIGRSMVCNFRSPEGAFHPILELPSRQPIERDDLRWSRSPGCYQLKPALAWYELAEAVGTGEFRALYEQAAADAIGSYSRFLPGHADREKVMDRLHAFLYFLEGLLPLATQAPYAAALCDGIQRTAGYLREIAPRFARADVYAQLLRIRLHADAAGAVPLNRAAAQEEAEALESFQTENGCFIFGRKDGAPMPFDNPVSTAFALQALALLNGCARPQRHLLI